MGGKIDINSEKGAGSLFHFTIRFTYLTEEEKAQLTQAQALVTHTHLLLHLKQNRKNL